MKRMLALALGLAIVGAVPSGVLAAEAIKVETRNLYLGADLNPVIGAEDPDAAMAAIMAALEQIEANNFPVRADALAQEIVGRRPHLVGLQEVFNFTLNGDNGPPPFRDYLTDLLDALAAKGAMYEAVASVQNIDLDIPLAPDGSAVLGLTDRDVILARKDILGAVYPVPFFRICDHPSLDGGPGCNYSAVVVLEDTPIGRIRIERGFVGVDAEVGGKTYRFLNTHLEVQNFLPPDPNQPNVVPLGSVQAAQASELMALLGASLMLLPPLNGTANPIVVGDINSSPDAPIFFDPFFPMGGELVPLFPPYMQLANGTNLVGMPTMLGPFADVWDLRPGKPPGFTCCELADLSNPTTLDDERIDVLFSLQTPDAVKANVIGNEPPDKTKRPRLWPSDHAGVVGALTFDD